MPPAVPLLPRACLTMAFTAALAACGSPTPAKTGTPPLDQRLLDLERRVESLEARPEVHPPYRDKAEIEAHIKSLEDERARLLVDYRPQHPAVRDIERRLGILNAQKKMLE